MSDQDRERVDDEAEGHALSDLDQAMTKGAQTGSANDQSTADADQHAAERDQLASERDQAAADRDEAINERADGGGGSRAGYARSRRARSRSALERDLTTEARSHASRVRDDAATTRDEMADERDAVARARDQLAREQDERAAGDGGGAVARRDQGAAQREAAARDRQAAAADRRQAAIDRAATAEGRSVEGVDQVTHALRRRAGLRAILREMDRAGGVDEPLVVALVEVDDLKSVNDRHGRGAGDELLRAVVRMITQHLGSADVIARFGGSEFVCSLSGHDASRVRERFERISNELADTANGATFTVGIAQRQPQDTLDELIGRAQTAMMQPRGRPAA